MGLFYRPNPAFDDNRRVIDNVNNQLNPDSIL